MFQLIICPQNGDTSGGSRPTFHRAGRWLCRGPRYQLPGLVAFHGWLTCQIMVENRRVIAEKRIKHYKAIRWWWWWCVFFFKDVRCFKFDAVTRCRLQGRTVLGLWGWPSGGPWGSVRQLDWRSVEAVWNSGLETQLKLILQMGPWVATSCFFLREIQRDLGRSILRGLACERRKLQCWC